MKHVKCCEHSPLNSHLCKDCGTEFQKDQRLNNLRKKLTLICAALCFFVSMGAAQPVTVYNNFGSGNGGFDYSTGTSYMIAGFNTGFLYVEQAQTFTPNVSGYLTDIYLGMGMVLSFTTGTIHLVPDLGSFPLPQDALESWVLNALPSIYVGQPTTHLVSVNHPFLAAGQSYWVWISVGNGSSAGWGQNVTGAIGHMAQRQFEYDYLWVDQGNDNPLAAMQVDITYSVGLDDLTSAQSQAILHQNVPNPFNLSTSITFELPQNEFVNLSIFDNSGRLVRTFNESYCDAGIHQVQWNGENNEGFKVPGGIYIYCLKTKDGITRSHQMVLIK